MIPRMRTIKECMEEIKKLDPNTAFREYCLRDLVLNGEIPSISAGKKRLINLDVLFDYLNNEQNKGGACKW